MRKLSQLLLALDARWVRRGPCAMCGGTDARHRLWDSIDERARLDGVADAMRDFAVTREAVLEVTAAFRAARRAHRPLPGRYPL